MKKRGKLFFSVLAILVVIMSMSILLVACKEADAPTPPQGEQHQQVTPGGDKDPSPEPNPTPNPTHPGENWYPIGPSKPIIPDPEPEPDPVVPEPPVVNPDTGKDPDEGKDDVSPVDPVIPPAPPVVNPDEGKDEVDPINPMPKPPAPKPEPEPDKDKDEKPNPPAPKPNPNQKPPILLAYSNVSTAFANTYMVDGKAVGWDLDVTAHIDLHKLLKKYTEISAAAPNLGLPPIPMDKIPNVIGSLTIVSKGRLDPTSITDTKFDMLIAINGKTLIEMAAKEDYLFIQVGDNFKRALKSFDLYNSIKDIYIGTTEGNEAFETVKKFLSTGLQMIFKGKDVKYEYAKDEVAKTETFTFDNPLTYIVDFAGSLGLPEDVTAILGLVKSLNFHLSATLDISNPKRKTIVGLDIAFPDLDLDLDLKKANVSSQTNPDVQLPEGYNDANIFIRTNALNLEVKGDFELKDNGGAMIYRAHWDLLIDVDLFKYINSGLTKSPEGVFGFDPMMIMNDPNNRLFFNVTHVCGVDCTHGAFCDNHRIGKTDMDGSILSLAYAPKQMGSNFFYVSINGDGILPHNATLLNFLRSIGVDLSIIGDMAVDQIRNKLGKDGNNNIGMALDPYTLFGLPEPNAPASTFADGDPAPVDPMQAALKALMGSMNIKTFLKDGYLKVGVNEMLDMIKKALGPDLSNVGVMLDDMFAGAKDINITIPEGGVVYGEIKDNDDFRVRFLKHNDKRQKVFNFSQGVLVGFTPVDATPISTLKFDTDKTGNIKITKGDIKTCDDQGNPIPLTPGELDVLFSGGAEVSYVYTTLTNKQPYQAKAKVVSVEGFDRGRTEVVQNVRINISDPHGFLYVVARDDLMAKVGVGDMINGLAMTHAQFKVTVPVVTSRTLEDVEGNEKEKYGTSCHGDATRVPDHSRYNADKVYEHYWSDDGRSDSNNKNQSSLDPKAKLITTYSNGRVIVDIQNPENFKHHFDYYNFVIVRNIFGNTTERRTVITACEDFDMVYKLYGVEYGRRRVKVRDYKFLDKQNSRHVGDALSFLDEPFKIALATEKNPDRHWTYYKIKEGERIESVRILEGSQDGIYIQIKNPTPDNPNIRPDVKFTFKKPGRYRVEVRSNLGLLQYYTFPIS